MSISALSSLQNTYQLGKSANDEKVKSDLQSLSSDLQSNNITAAQKDFSSMLSDATQLQTELLQNSQTQPTTQSSALNALSTALQSGDTTGAQSALGSLENTMKAHHHHHHHGAACGSKSGSSTDNGGDSDGQSGTSQISTDFQTLNSALQAGDVTTAQQALLQLQKDDPRLAGALGQSTATSATTAS